MMRGRSEDAACGEHRALRKLLCSGTCHPVTKRAEFRLIVPESSQTARISACTSRTLEINL